MLFAPLERIFADDLSHACKQVHLESPQPRRWEEATRNPTRHRPGQCRLVKSEFAWQDSRYRITRAKQESWRALCNSSTPPSTRHGSTSMAVTPIRPFLREKFDPVPFPPHLKGHSSSPFVWLERPNSTLVGGPNEIEPIGGRSHFAEWIEANLKSDAELVAAAKEGPGFCAHGMHNKETSFQSTADVRPQWEEKETSWGSAPSSLISFFKSSTSRLTSASPVRWCFFCNAILPSIHSQQHPPFQRGKCDLETISGFAPLQKMSCLSFLFCMPPALHLWNNHVDILVNRHGFKGGKNKIRIVCWW